MFRNETIHKPSLIMLYYIYMICRLPTRADTSSDVGLCSDDYRQLSHIKPTWKWMYINGSHWNKIWIWERNVFIIFFLSLLNDMSLKKTLGHEFFGGYVGYVGAKCQPLLSIFVVSKKSRLRSTNGMVLSIPTQNIRLPFPIFWILNRVRFEWKVKQLKVY